MPQIQQQQSRVNLTDLKTQLVKKLGPDRSKRYFYILNRLLSKNLSKGEFDKLCLRIIGRENLPLHNQLIRSILKNATQAKVPPPKYEKEGPSKPTVSVTKKYPSAEDGYQQGGSSLPPTSGQTPLVWSNGDVLPMSPRKSRSGLRDRRSRDRPSPLGPNGKADFVTHTATTPDNEGGKGITENGGLKSHDSQRLMQHHRGLAEQPENERELSLQRPTKRPRTKKSPDNPDSVHGKGYVELRDADDLNMAQQGSYSGSAQSPLCAPLGIPFCQASVGGSRKVLPTTNSNSFAISSDSGVLFDTETLKRRMEQIVGIQGLEGVSPDCANLLNNGLDVYLKRLIRSCIDLVGSKSGHEPTRLPLQKQHPHEKLVNGIKPGYQLQMQNIEGPMDGMQRSRTRPISLLDFKVAMELNPQQLGEDWPLLLERICMQESEE